MKSVGNFTSEFEKIYENLYNQNIQKVEKIRKKCNFTLLFIVIFVILAVLFKFFASDPTMDPKIMSRWNISAFITLLLAMYTFFKYNVYKEKYTKSYKNEIIVNLVKALNNKLTYSYRPLNGISSQEDYKNAKFDNKPYNIYDSNDYIQGELIKNVKINISDINVKYKTGTGKNKVIEDIFSGIFAKTICNKNIEKEVRVSVNKIKILDRKDRVEMDSKEFEKYFDVYSKDKILAMRILTSDVLLYLTDFCKTLKINFEIIFRKNNIFFRFYTGPMFEPLSFKNSLDKKLIFSYYSVLKFILDVTTKMNDVLNEIEI